MNLRNFAAGVLLTLASLFISPAFAAQGTLCLPTTGVYGGLTAAGYINAAIKALETQNSGASAPANDCTLSPVAGQAWLNTTTTPYVLNYYDGANWLAIGTINASTHQFISNGYGLALSGSTSGATNITPAAVASGNWTLPAATDTVVGKATTDTLTNKTLLDGSTKIANTSDATKKLAFDVSGVTTATTRTLTVPDASGTMLLTTNAPPAGQVQLTRTSSTVVTLLPYQGRYVSFPSGTNATIGSSGVAATITNAYINGTSGQTLTASTLYYVYLFLNSGTPTLDFSTTGHATDSSTGIEIKSGDNTRVLVGMVYPQAGPVFTDTVASHLIATWFNRRPRQLTAAYTATHATSSTSFVELDPEIRVQFLGWGDATGTFSTNQDATCGSTPTIYVGVSLDGSTSSGAFFSGAFSFSSSAAQATPGAAGTFIPGEGFHYVTVLAATSANTVTFQYSAAKAGLGQLSGAVNS